MKRSVRSGKIQSTICHLRRRSSRSSAVVLAFTLWLLGAATGWTQTNIELVLHNFTNSPDGYTPIESLVTGVDNALYGITISGGTNGGYGTLFKINPDGTGYKILHHFNSSDTGVGGLTTPPYPLLMVMQTSDGMLYGSTYYGGTNNNGSLFRLNSDGSLYTVVHSFSAADIAPTSIMPGRDGEIYGTTLNVVFRFDPASGNYTILHTFTGTPDGATAFGKLIQATDGTLYGTTYFGGTNSEGSVYKVTTNGNTYAELHAFAGVADGVGPYAGVIQGNDGMLYGTTRSGGTNGGGTVYKLNLDGSDYRVICNFSGSSDGGALLGSLVQGPGNVLYGTTASGGAQSVGTVFALNPDGSGRDILHNFANVPDGAKPYAGLALGTFTGGTGALYGTTVEGGSRAVGTVFAILINPPLSITPVSSQTDSNQTVVFWPVWALNYTLQSTTNLATGTWVTASNTVPVTGVQVTNSAPTMFYRLLRQ